MNVNDLKEFVESYGEIHIYIEEHETIAGDEPIGIRNGDNYEFDLVNERIEIDSQTEYHLIPADSIVYVNVPNGSFPD